MTFLCLLAHIWALSQIAVTRSELAVSGTLHVVEVVHPRPSRRVFSHRYILQPDNASLRSIPVEHDSHISDPRYRENYVTLYGDYKSGVLNVVAVKPQGAPPPQQPPRAPTILAVTITETGTYGRGASESLAAMVARDMDLISKSRWRPNITVQHASVAPMAGCDYEGVTDRAFELLGVSRASYDLVSILLPTTFGQHSGSNECVLDGTPWKGLAYLGGKYSWIRLSRDNVATTVESRIWGHELVHNMGLGHSMTRNNEYGDRTCMMGNLFDLRGGGTLNGAALVQLGWHELHPESGRVGRVTLAPLGASNQVYTIGAHVVSFRHKLAGHDGTLNVGDGVSIHRIGGRKRTLLDHGIGYLTSDNISVAVRGYTPTAVTFDVTEAARAESHGGHIIVAAVATVCVILVLGNRCARRGNSVNIF